MNQLFKTSAHHFLYCTVMHVKKILILGLFMYCTGTNQAQNPTMTRMAETLDQRLSEYPQTKIYVHTDKPYYTVGDDIWYALYAINANDHQNLPLSNVVYVTLQDPEGNFIISQHIKLDGKFANGDISLEKDWTEGMYVLKAYTAYMKNFDQNLIFSKEIPIYTKTDNTEQTSNSSAAMPLAIKFFPEGGDLIHGLSTRVAFEVSDTTIKEVIITDEEGNEVATGKTVSNNQGFFNLLPDKNQRYHTTINGQSFKLPQVKPTGYSFVVNTLNADKIYIDILSSEDASLDGTFLIAHIRGTPYVVNDQLTGSKMSMALDRDLLPEGVSQITLFDREGRPLTERAFYIRSKTKGLQVEARIPYEYYNKRQNAEVEIELKGQAKGSGVSDFSVSVVDARKVLGLKEGLNIENYFFLASEFSSSISNIDQYFSENSAETRLKMDILMLTKGWTRFNWNDIKDQKAPDIIFPPENGFTVSGQVLEKKKPTKALVNISKVDEDLFFTTIDTDSDGKFTAFGFDLEGEEQLNLSAFKKGKKDKEITRNISISVDDQKVEHLTTENIYQYEGVTKNDVKAYINNAYEMVMLDSMYDGMQVQLDEVILQADRRASIDQKLKKERGIIYTNYDKRVFVDSMPFQRMYTNVFDMVRDRVPGVNIVGPAGDRRFRLRGGSNSILGSSDALVVVDGTPVSYGYVNTMNVDQIEFIDILKGLAASSIYSTPNGVVAIYTRTDSQPGFVNRTKAANVANVLYKGYYTSREFYSPDYGKGFAGAEKPDLRTTLYWNPRITTENGKAKFSFYTADQLTTYTIEIQGITEEGMPFVGYSDFEVR